MKAHELLSDETKWTKGEYARNKEGRAVDPRSDERCVSRFCLIGAIMRVTGKEDVPKSMLHKIACAIKPETTFAMQGQLSNWNDAPERTFEEVRELLIKLNI